MALNFWNLNVNPNFINCHNFALLAAIGDLKASINFLSGPLASGEGLVSVLLAEDIVVETSKKIILQNFRHLHLFPTG